MRTLLTCLLICLLQSEIFAQDIHFNFVRGQQGIWETSVGSIYIDELERIWFTTQGVFCYDGVSAVPLEMKKIDGTTVRFDRSRSICGNRNGIIYFLSDDELIKYDSRYHQFTSLGKETSAVAVFDSTVWIARNNEIYTYRKGDQSPVLFAKLNTKAIRYFHYSKSGILWAGTTRGLYFVDQAKHEQEVIPVKEVLSFWEDRNQNIWCGTMNGLYRISPDFQTKGYFTERDIPSTSGDQIRSITQDLDGTLWLGTPNGLVSLNPDNGLSTRYLSNKSKPNSLSHNSIRSICCDKRGTIWVGPLWGGFNYFNPQKKIFRYILASQPSDYASATVKSITPVNKDELLITTQNYNNYVYNSKDQHITQLPETNLGITHSLPDPIRNRTYCSTESGNIYIFDNKQRKFLLNPISIKSTNPYIKHLALLDDKLIVSLHNKLMLYNFNTKDLTPFLSELTEKGTHINFILSDGKKRFWIVFFSSEILCHDIQTRKTTSYKELISNKKLIQSIRITNIYQTHSGEILVTSSGGGVLRFNEKKNIFEPYITKGNGLMSNYCYDVKEGLNNNLIVFESDGITLYDRNTRKSRFVSNKQFPTNRIFPVGLGTHVDSQGNIYIGTLDGLIICNQLSIANSENKSDLYFSRLFVNSEEVNPGDGTHILDQSLPYTQKLRISSLSKSFDIDISDKNYPQTDVKTMEYTLDGFDKQWIKTTSNRIHYTNIAPGNYTLKVRESASDTASSNTISLPIRVYPPFYSSWWAWTFYIVFIAGISLLLIRFYMAKRHLQLSLDYEHREKLRIEETNQAKVKFYINISHEFRTPISLIMAQIDHLLINNPNIATPIRKTLNRIFHNAENLHNLVTEILDFRKLELGKMILKPEPTDLNNVISESADAFRERMALQKITLRLKQTTASLLVNIDRIQFVKVINNLIINACKYTPSEGTITISSSRDECNVYLKVSDTGKGIPEDEKDNIFERFYQANNNGSSGSGVGLSYAKDIVEQHQGRITVCNNTPEAGCTFTIAIPAIEQQEMPPTENQQLISSINTPANEELADEEFAALPVLLIVEDNEEMLDLLEEIFTPYFSVKTATDGTEAVDILRSLIPDLILSDIMMKEMSGTELCSYVKSNYDLCHIPVLLLTACDLDESKMEGFLSGADDYVTKPFNSQLLITRCNNLINNRHRIHEKFAKEPKFSPKILASTNSDTQLIEKAYNVIEKNLANPDFDVDVFTAEMAMSRVKLYGKIKGLTGMTPRNFILNIKLKIAAELLVTRPDLLIADITYQLGFSSPRHFGACFRELFGLIPSDYRKQHLNQAESPEHEKEDA